MKQLNLGEVLVVRAVRTLDLTAAVPQEDEAGLWDEAGRLMHGAALFGHTDACTWVRQEQERQASLWMFDQQEFYQLVAGF